jgi:zinc transport system substrate-binding protein
MESWAEKVADTLPETVKVVCASEKINSINSDPHIWLNIENAQQELANIYSAFAEADSENAEKYNERYIQYSNQLDEIKTEYQNAGLEGKKLFVTHGAYGYLCEEFGMEQIALEGISGDSDPSPAQMAKIVEEIKADNAKCIFYDPIEGDKIANAVAAEAGVEALPLYTFEVDSEDRDYAEIMKFNLEQLKRIK